MSDERLLLVVKYPEIKHIANEVQEIKESLHNPMEEEKLRDLVFSACFFLPASILRPAPQPPTTNDFRLDDLLTRLNHPHLTVASVDTYLSGLFLVCAYVLLTRFTRVRNGEIV